YTESAASRAALNFGLEMAAQLAQNVVVGHAGPGSEHKSESALTRAGSAELEQHLARFDVPPALRPYSRGRSPVRASQDGVAERNPYVVVIGAARRSGFSKFMMGSVADELLRELPVPVVSVKVPEPSVATNKKE